MTFLLLVICFCMPIHLAFKTEDVHWCWTYLTIDLFFVVDMIFTFFTTIPENGDEEELTDRKKIAGEYFGKYLNGWFTIELFAVIPVDFIFSILSGAPQLCSLGAKKFNQVETSNANTFLRFPKILKMARFARMIRMLKVFKLMKKKKHLQKKYHEGLAVSSGLERLCILFLTTLYAQHILACAWIFIGSAEAA